MSKVELPGADLGLNKEEPAIAELLKAQGYAARQDRQDWGTRPLDINLQG